MQRTNEGAGIFEPGEPALAQFHVTKSLDGRPLDWKMWVRHVPRIKLSDGVHCLGGNHERYEPVYEMCGRDVQMILDRAGCQHLFVCACNGHLVE